MHLFSKRRVVIYLLGLTMLLIFASYNLVSNRKVLWFTPSNSEVSSVISENNNETVEVLAGHNSLDMKRLVKTIISKLDFTLRKVLEVKDIIKWDPHVFSVIPRHFLPGIKNPCWYEEFSPEGNPDPYKGNAFIQYLERLESLSMNLKTNFHKLLLHQDGKQFRLRCLPYFYIIGLQKCGTTDFFAHLQKHPGIKHAVIKEPRWWNWRRLIHFNNTIKKGVPVEDYLDLFDETAQAIQRGILSGARHALNLISGEATPSTMWNDNAWSLLNPDWGGAEPPFLALDFIHAVQPEAKIIIMLRDPTERLYSDYLFYLYANESAKAFHQRVEDSLKLFQSCLLENSLRSCTYNGTLTAALPVRLQVGLYVVFLLDWLTVFPREQILVLRLEDYAANRAATLKKVFDFLQLGPLSKSVEAAMTERKVINARWETDRVVGPMLRETKALLREFHQPFNQKLSIVLKDEAFLWRET